MYRSKCKQQYQNIYNNPQNVSIYTLRALYTGVAEVSIQNKQKEKKLSKSQHFT